MKVAWAMAAAAQSSLERRLRSAAYLKEVFTGSRLWVSVASLGKDAESCIDETQSAHPSSCLPPLLRPPLPMIPPYYEWLPC